MLSKIRFHAACAALIVSAVSSPALAQQQEGLDPGEQLFLSSCSTSSTTAGFAAAGFAIIAQREDQLQKEILIMQQVAVIDDYMKNNEPGVRMAFAMAGGDELDEIATLMGHDTRLTREQRSALRASRASLLAAVDGDDANPLAGARHVYTVFANVLWGHQVAEVTR